MNLITVPSAFFYFAISELNHNILSISSLHSQSSKSWFSDFTLFCFFFFTFSDFNHSSLWALQVNLITLLFVFSVNLITILRFYTQLLPLPFSLCYQWTSTTLMATSDSWSDFHSIVNPAQNPWMPVSIKPPNHRFRHGEWKRQCKRIKQQSRRSSTVDQQNQFMTSM